MTGLNGFSVLKIEDQSGGAVFPHFDENHLAYLAGVISNPANHPRLKPGVKSAGYQNQVRMTGRIHSIHGTCVAGIKRLEEKSR